MKLRQRFREIVTSEEEIRDVVGHPPQRSAAKAVHSIDDHSRRFIAHAPFVFIASAGMDGSIDVSPKGDPAGFVRVIDHKTLAIPDRLGNRRVDTFRNVLRNPNVGLIFVIPGVTYTLRVSVQALIVRELDLRRSFYVGSKILDYVVAIHVHEVLSHCPKCMIRSGLWQPEAWPDTTNLSTFAEMLKAHAEMAETVDEIQTIIDTANRERLY